MRLEHDGAECRRQGQGVQSGETDCDGHGDTKLTIERTARSAHEAHGHEHGHHHQRNRHDGTAQFAHGINRSLSR